MADKHYDPDEPVGLDMKPEDALEELLGGAGASDEDRELEDPEDDD